MNASKGAEGQSGAFKGQNAPRGRGAVPLIGECPCAAPAPPGKGQSGNDNFTPPIEVIAGQTRILLSDAASRHLEATGEACFVIVSKTRHPEKPGRWVIHLAPAPLATVRDAEAVLFGEARAVRIRTPKPQRKNETIV